MGGVSPGERQRREINTYNLFYSAVTARANPSLSAHGVRIPVMFPVIEDQSNSVRAEPDFVLYDGETCVLTEIKSGNNISQGHITQMEHCSSVSIETAEDALKDAKVRDKTDYDGSLSAVESVIVYQDLNEEYVEEARDTSADFRTALDDITDHAVLMTQDYGGELRVLEGEFANNGSLQSVLRRGIELPQNPPDEVMLTENMEQEILAMAVCDVWGEKAVDYENGVEVTRNEVRDYFSPRHNVSLDDLTLVFEFLVEFGACDHVEDHCYRFTRDHIDKILTVESQVMSESVADYLHGSDQSTLGDHLEDRDSSD